ncbi:magnesium-translocating P-type ATPase [Enterocloster clostridioformis]|uniref:magnesium-translocating P-type ATPase n=3 Tax=Enterocloster clostridioformis TaxID=1531 RepID=UPI00080CA349|nr:magnesium-translocating P-type ATPase [Enterocloster clostridioformis]ANU46664.1 magnesium-translocating P-type ATPase [Lachnoclostridium sp. YL32]NDO31526.1 magnesium-translocating P-type ATPase [Enterocloster clostridioformis]OXE65370.1 magnesium-translocating P-type ATPase [Enterocloster clostridioformis]QQQ98621.1 magnesium-translocating P-type ATPase [Enterocloster clostridioformis]
MSKTTLLDSRIKKYAYREASEIYRDIGASSDGLSSEQVETMRERYGTNSFTERNNDTTAHRLRRAFINPFNVILFVLGIVSLVTDVILASNFARNATTAIIIFSMILISGVIRLIQELRAKNAAEQLDRLIHESITVKRGGELMEIPAEELVVGDLVLFSAGDRVPADIRLIKVTDLFISQAAITGESAILEKSSRRLSYGSQETLTQLENLAFMATTVISGKGEGIVLAVGKDTLYGSFTKIDSDDKNFFQKGANSIAWVMLRFMAVLVPTVFVVLGISDGKWMESFAFALSVAVGLMPEMLPMVITACLAKGSLAMSKKQTIIKDINAMQGFGSMDVLCMDKTGTLTNESILLEYYMDILGNENTEVLDLAFLNSIYHSGVRNPIDNAILACQTMPGCETHYTDLLARYQKTDEIPFDYTRKFVSTLVKDESGESQLIMKGDISHIVARCIHVEYRGEILPIEKGGMQSVSSVVDDMLQDGMKVIAIARKNVGQQNQITPADEKDMILMGYLAFFDAPKKTAKESVAALKKLKVSPKILTGDQAAIAVSVCRRVGISAETVLTGAKLDEMTDSELSTAVEEIHVFAELTPGQKVRLVSALRENGHTVGFLGDGINDIPALNEANVGISVDTAVDVAKDAADVVLLQKDLNVLEQGILEGRKTFTNMLKYIKITASSNFGNIFAIVCASAFLPFLPMTSVQLLLLNLLYDILCIVLPWDNVDEEETMSPRDWSGKTLGRFMMSFGPISSLFDIATFLFLYYFLCPMLCGGATYLNLTDPALQLQYVSLFQTGWFLESMWTQVLILHFLRTHKVPFVQSRPSASVICITLAGVFAFTAITLTSGASLFGLTKLPFWYFVFLLIVALVYMLLTTVAKYFYQKKYHELI